MSDNSMHQEIRGLKLQMLELHVKVRQDLQIVQHALHNIEARLDILVELEDELAKLLEGEYDDDHGPMDTRPEESNS